MTDAESMSAALAGVKFNQCFTEAVLRLRDDSRLCFCHRVGERWAKAVGPVQCENRGGLADKFLAKIVMFRLNAKHLDIEFEDDSRWDQSLQRLRNEGQE